MGSGEQDRQARINAVHWDSVIDHYSEELHRGYDEVVGGGISLSSIEVAEVGNVRGLQGAHLQCGIGLDTISLARLGATMVGYDISSKACTRAEDLARRCGEDVIFIVANVLNLTGHRPGGADFVYTSHGVLRWVPDLLVWANNARSLLRPNGWLYLFETHPLTYRLAGTTESGFNLEGDYFDESPRHRRIEGTHLGDARHLASRDVVHTDWTISTVINGILSAGFEIEFYNEHPGASYSRRGMLPSCSNGLWSSSDAPPMPLAYSLRAHVR